MGDQYVVPAATTTVAESSYGGAVAFQRLAPDGRTYLPTAYARSHDQSPPMPPPQPIYAPPPPQRPIYAAAPPMMMMPGAPYASYAPYAPYAPQVPAAPHSGGGGFTAHPPCKQREAVHAPSEPTAVPYNLPNALATAIGFESSNGPRPEGLSCEISGDVIKIRVKKCVPCRWRLELACVEIVDRAGKKDTPKWGANVDAICDTKEATFRLHDAGKKEFKVRAARITPNGDFMEDDCPPFGHPEHRRWTDWVYAEVKAEPAPAPAPPPPATVAPAAPPPPQPAASMALAPPPSPPPSAPSSSLTVSPRASTAVSGPMDLSDGGALGGGADRGPNKEAAALVVQRSYRERVERNGHGHLVHSSEMRHEAQYVRYGHSRSAGDGSGAGGDGSGASGEGGEGGAVVTGIEAMLLQALQVSDLSAVRTLDEAVVRERLQRSRLEGLYDHVAALMPPPAAA